MAIHVEAVTSLLRFLYAAGDCEKMYFIFTIDATWTQNSTIELAESSKLGS
jgi:hypothetical protein